MEKPLSSPNFDARDPNVGLVFLVFHYTGMPSAEDALARLCDPSAKVSAHYLVDENGKIFPLVREDMRAWHAGKSFWRGITDLNSASVGIELANPGHEFGYLPFPEAQITALEGLSLDIMRRHGLGAASALGHSDIAPDRKQDPGELFPWRRLAERGIGIWPEMAATGADEGCLGAVSPANLMAEVGYGPPERLREPDFLRAAVTAFQRRYLPDTMTGTADAGTMAVARAVAKRLRELLI